MFVADPDNNHSRQFTIVDKNHPQKKMNNVFSFLIVFGTPCMLKKLKNLQAMRI